MLDRTDHNRLATEAAKRTADKYIPAVDRDVTRTDNAPPELIADEAAVASYAATIMAKSPAIASANDASPLLKAFIADNPVIQTAQEAQKAAVWIESARKTLGALEDERKPKVSPLNAALKSINEPYRLVREPIEAMVGVLAKRWNKWDSDERARRAAEAERVRREAEEAAARAAALIDQANDAQARADVGECDVDVGSAITDAQAAIRDAKVLGRVAARADHAASHVRVSSELGGKALSSRKRRIIVIDDPCAAIKVMGLTEKIAEAIQQSAKAFEEAFGELPAGTHEDFERSI